MIPTGTLDDHGRTLVLRRTFSASVQDVWASVTESERLSRWFGTWTGDPTTGTVMVTMNAEAEPVPPVRYDITACDPPRLLAVHSTNAFGHWKLTVELSEAEAGTVLVLRQEDLDPGAVADLGPGWEWYLDRLAAAVTGEQPPTLAAFDADYAPMGEAYRSLVTPPG